MYLSWDPFALRHPLCYFSELRYSIIILFCQAVLICWTLCWSCLLAHKASHFPLAKVTVENTTVDPCGVSKENKKPWRSPYEDSTTSQTESKLAMAPSHPQVPIVLWQLVPQEGEPEAVGRHDI